MRLEASFHALRRLGRADPHHDYPHLRVKRANDAAALSYVPSGYVGRVALIRPSRYFLSFSNPQYGWERVVHGGPEVHELPVYPKGMLIEPFCRHLAKTLTSLLAKKTLHAEPLVVSSNGPSQSMHQQDSTALRDL